MTVLSDKPPFTRHVADGVKEVFHYIFEMKDYSTVIVKVDDVPATFVREKAHVTISPAPIAGAIVSLARVTTIDQLTHWSPQEAFKGPKTEDAQDKLIMLKQEADFNEAAMNLQSVPFLDNVTLINNVGTNAVIPIWDGLAGVFSGEVNDVIPDAGDVVAKPLNFVYMQYDDLQEQVLTTTLYPLEAADAIDLSITLDSFSMSPVPNDALDLGVEFTSGVLEDILLITPTYPDDLDLGVVFTNGLLEDILLSNGPYPDDLDLGVSFVDGLLEDKLVSIYSPDEALEMSITLDSLSMTPV